MAQYANDFTQYPLATKLDSGSYDITLLAGDADWTIEAVEDASGISGRALKVQRSSVLRPQAFWRWDEVPETDQGQIYLEFYTVNGHRNAVFGTACSLNADATTGYIGVDRIAGGTFTVVPVVRVPATATNSGLASGTSYNFEDNRVRCLLLEWSTSGSDVTVKHKTWWKNESEPGTFTVTTTRTEHAGLGRVGFNRPIADNLESRLLFYSVGTGADTAPRSMPAVETPITFTGTVPTLNGTVGTAFSQDLSSYFSGTETPFAYSVQAGTLPDGLSLNTSTGVISGTPSTAGDATGIVIRGTDATPDTADSNSFTISIAAAPAAESFNADAGTFTLTGGAITFAASTATVTVTDPLVNNTGTVLASQTGIVASVLAASTLESVFETTGLTTNASGLLDTITSGVITPASSYYVVVKLADGSVGIAGPITAS